MAFPIWYSLTAKGGWPGADSKPTVCALPSPICSRLNIPTKPTNKHPGRHGRHPIAPGDSSHPFPNRHLPPDSGRPTSARTSPKHIQKFASPSGIQAKAGKQTSNHEAIHCTMQRLEQEEKGEQSCMLLLMQRGKAKDALRCMHHRSALRWPSKHAASAIAAHCIRQYTPEHRKHQRLHYLPSHS